MLMRWVTSLTEHFEVAFPILPALSTPNMKSVRHPFPLYHDLGLRYEFILMKALLQATQTSASVHISSTGLRGKLLRE